MRPLVQHAVSGLSQSPHRTADLNGKSSFKFLRAGILGFSCMRIWIFWYVSSEISGSLCAGRKDTSMMSD
nr:hypothetical protein [Nitrosospira multiformis]